MGTCCSQRDDKQKITEVKSGIRETPGQTPDGKDAKVTANVIEKKEVEKKVEPEKPQETVTQIEQVSSVVQTLTNVLGQGKQTRTNQRYLG